MGLPCKNAEMTTYTDPSEEPEVRPLEDMAFEWMDWGMSVGLHDPEFFPDEELLAARAAADRGYDRRRSNLRLRQLRP
jgi:hypothetical protein